MKWQKVKLGDVCECLGKGKHPASFSDIKGTYPFIVSGLSEKKCNEYDNDDECFIIGDGGCANIHYVNGKYAASDHTYIFKSKDDRILTKYIYKYLSGNIRILEDGFKGAGIKNISKSYIMSILIPLPPKEKQERIAKELDAVSDLLAKQKQLLTEQDTLIKATFYDMFGDLVTNNRNWLISNIGDNLDVLTDYHANGSYETLKNNVTLHDSPNFALMIRTTDLEKNDFVHDVKYIDEHAYNYLSKSKVFGGEIIINKIGSAGKVYLMPKLNRPVSLAMNQFLLRFHKNINHIFVYYLLVSEFYTSKIQENVKGAVTKTITKDAIRDIKIPVPPLPLQQKFADIVEQIEAQKQKIKSAITETETLFNALMAKYFDEE